MTLRLLCCAMCVGVGMSAAAEAAPPGVHWMGYHTKPITVSVSPGRPATVYVPANTGYCLKCVHPRGRWIVVAKPVPSLDIALDIHQLDQHVKARQRKRPKRTRTRVKGRDRRKLGGAESFALRVGPGWFEITIVAKRGSGRVRLSSRVQLPRPRRP